MVAAIFVMWEFTPSRATVWLFAGVELAGPDGLILVGTAAVITACAAWAYRDRFTALNRGSEKEIVPPARPGTSQDAAWAVNPTVLPERVSLPDGSETETRHRPAPIIGPQRPAIPRSLMGWARLFLIPTGLTLLILANTFLNQQDLSFVALLMLLVGLTFWAFDTWLAGGAIRPRPARMTQGAYSATIRWSILGVSIAAAIATYLWSGGNTFRVYGVACWTISILAWNLAWWPKRRDTNSVRQGPHFPFALSARDMLVILVLGVAVAAGIFFRFYQIDETPLDPTSDHAEKLLDVTDVLNGQYPVFFERNTGREPMQFYLTAGLIRAFDLPTNFTTLKIGTALIGAMAIPFLYLLAAELAGRTVGLFAAGLFAISAWPVEISRAGLRFPYALVGSAAVLWLLLRWMRTRDRRDALLCGLGVGVGLYGYSPFRVVILAVGLGLAFAFVASRDGAARRRVVSDSLLIGATAGVIFVPLGRYALERPDMFWSRAGGRLTGDEGGQLTGDDGGARAIAAFFDELPVFLNNNWKRRSGSTGAAIQPSSTR